MWKRAAACLVLVMIVMMLFSCAAFPEKESIAKLSGEEATAALKGRTEKEMADHWGEPDDTLSGFYGDIYMCDDRQIVIYYDAGSKVTDVLISDR